MSTALRDGISVPLLDAHDLAKTLFKSHAKLMLRIQLN
jgi:hypothetical protein